MFDAENGYDTSLIRDDLCGLAVAGSGMIVTDGLGGVLSLTGRSLALLTRADRAWDYHNLAI